MRPLAEPAVAVPVALHSPSLASAGVAVVTGLTAFTDATNAPVVALTILSVLLPSPAIRQPLPIGTTPLGPEKLLPVDGGADERRPAPANESALVQKVDDVDRLVRAVAEVVLARGRVDETDVEAPAAGRGRNARDIDEGERRIRRSSAWDPRRGSTTCCFHCMRSTPRRAYNRRYERRCAREASSAMRRGPGVSASSQRWLTRQKSLL